MAGNGFTDRRAEVANMTDEELIDSWEAASEEETENLSPFLQAVVEEMDRRHIAFSLDTGGG